MKTIVGSIEYLKIFRELHRSGITPITTFDLQPNSYSTGIVQNDIKMDALFKA